MQIRKDSKWIILIFLVTLVLLYKLFYNVRLYGHDTIFHTGSIIYLAKTISINNVFGDSIISNNVFKFGYGTWLFYPKLPHLLAAYFYLITNNVYLSMNIIYFVVTFLSGVSMFYLAKKMFNNKKVAFLATVIYLSYSYHICDIYIRDALAENFMFLVIPLVFWGLFELKDNNYKKFYVLFIFGYLIGMYSHLISMVFCTIFVFLFLLHYKEYFFKLKNIKALIVSGVIVTCLTLPFLTTVIEHRLLGDYTVFSTNFSSKFKTIYNYLSFDKYFIASKDAIPTNILVYIDSVVLLLILLTTFKFFINYYRKKYVMERKLLFFSFLICVAFVNSGWLWDHLPKAFSTIQFPWRIMTFFSATISLYSSLFFVHGFRFINKYIINSFYVVIIIFIICAGVNSIYYYGSEEYSYNYIITSKGFMGWQREYLPYVTNYKLYLYDHFYLDFGDVLEYKVSIMNGTGSVKIIKDNFPTMKFKVNNISDNVDVILPRIYYLGYKLYDEKNNEYLLNQSDNGLIKVNLKDNGIYTLKYCGTLYEKIAKFISLATIIFIFCYGGSYLWKKKR